MIRNRYHFKARGTLFALVWVAAVAALGCQGDVRVSTPTTPVWTYGEAGERSLQIAGTLVAQEGTCLEATLLYDGVELSGARVACRRSDGCTEVHLAGFVRTEAGRHTLAFQVLDQSRARVEYRAEGSVVVTRSGLGLTGVRLPLGPKHARLETGGAVQFELEFAD